MFVHCWRFQLTLEFTLAPCSLVRNQDSQEISCGQVSIHVRASTPPAQLKSSWATGSATEDLMRWIRIGSKNTDGGTLWQRITWNASGMLDVMKLLSRTSKDPFDSVPALNNANNGTGRTELEAKQQTSQIHTKPIIITYFMLPQQHSTTILGLQQTGSLQVACILNNSGS